jgi:trypsin
VRDADSNHTVYGMLRPALIALAAAALLLPAFAASAQASDFEYQVVGGHDANIEEYPWQAALAFHPDTQPPGDDAFERQFCGGVLVTPSVVLTAAHCVYDTDPHCGICLPVDEVLDPGDVNVVLGRTTLSNDGQGAEHAVQAVDYERIDDGTPVAYNPATIENDVAYLVLTNPAPINDMTVKQLQIAADNESSVWADGVYNEVTGWGSTTAHDGFSPIIFTPSDTLQGASVPIVHDDTCSANYGSMFNPDNMVCAGYPEGEVDACYGDSGGPLEAPLEGGEYRLIGLTSWGIGCAQPNNPGVYARVAGETLRDAIVARVEKFEGDLAIGDQGDVVADPGGGSPRLGPPKYPPPSSEEPAPQPPPSSSVPPPPPATTSTTTTTQTSKKNPFAKCRKITKKAKKKNPKNLKKAKKKRKKCMRKVKKQLRKAG